MEISDIRVRLVKDANERLKSVCSVTFDQEFVVRDVKIVEGTHGLFVAMPSRKLSFPCSKCRTQNHLRARFCNECGAQLAAPRIPSDGKGREKAHRDIAHPITPEFRQLVQERVLEAYRSECDKPEDAEFAPASVEADDHHENDDHENDDHEKADHEDDHHKVTDGASEYNSLIADLKGGGERRRTDEGDRESSGQRDEPRGRRRGRRGGRDRDEGERTAVAEKSHEEPETPPVERDSRVSEPAEADAPATARGESDTERESAFGVGVDEPAERKSAFGIGVDEPAERGPAFGVGVDEPEERRPVSAPAAGSEPAASEPVRSTEPAVEPPPTDEKEEEETEFGAGIL